MRLGARSPPPCNAPCTVGGYPLWRARDGGPCPHARLQPLAKSNAHGGTDCAVCVRAPRRSPSLSSCAGPPMSSCACERRIGQPGVPLGCLYIVLCASPRAALRATRRTALDDAAARPEASCRSTAPSNKAIASLKFNMNDYRNDNSELQIFTGEANDDTC